MLLFHSIIVQNFLDLSLGSSRIFFLDFFLNLLLAHSWICPWTSPELVSEAFSDLSQSFSRIWSRILLRFVLPRFAQIISRICHGLVPESLEFVSEFFLDLSQSTLRTWLRIFWWLPQSFCRTCRKVVPQLVQEDLPDMSQSPSRTCPKQTSFIVVFFIEILTRIFFKEFHRIPSKLLYEVQTMICARIFPCSFFQKTFIRFR